MKNFIILLIILVFTNTANAKPVGYKNITLLPTQSSTILYTSLNDSKIKYVYEIKAEQSIIDFSTQMEKLNKDNILVYWQKMSKNNTVGMINAQFFNMNTGELSFPLKANNIVYKKEFYEKWNYKSFSRITNNRVSIFDGFDNFTFTISQDYILGLDPVKDNKSMNSKVSRTFIAVKRAGICIENNKNNCLVDKYYFFVDNASTQSEMIKNIEEWGILKSDIIMLDGGGSSQMCSIDLNDLCDFLGEARKIPSVITINDK